MIKQDHILQFQKFLQFGSLTHGFSTRFFGDLRPSHQDYQQSLDTFTDALKISQKNLVRMDQVHGNTVYRVLAKDRGQTIPQTDGLFTEKKNIFLGVITADCIPLLFYDSKKNSIAAVHAGWRGLFSEIIKVGVAEMINQGSDSKDILVGIGPCIRVCHYDIAQEHADKLVAKFPDWQKFIVKRDDKLFLDLPAIAKHQLRSVGVLDENIEDGDYCTFEHEDIFSCRREGKDFGEMMGIIGKN